MKISKLHIDQFRHLENLDFDFTYQSGERKGQPLDKICFIGQSATGKTGLLELIFDNIKYALNLEILDNKHLFGHHGIKNLDGEINIFINNDVFKLQNEEVFFKGQKYIYEFKDGTFGVSTLIPTEDKKKLLYFKANLISEKNIDILTKNPVDLLEKYHDKISNTLFLLNYPSNNIVSLFDDNIKPETWLFLLNDILTYRKNFTQKISELINNKDLNKFALEYQKWQKENPNELENFATKLNPILEKLNLEVDLVNTEYSVPIKNKRTDEIIPIQNTSTGTKGLLLSFLPLFKLNTKDAIILIDEPERSLYPDMQMDLMDHYQRLAPDAQFIVATHSPFIAASFEPEERFILYFDEEGKVAVRRGSSPIGDDPNDMLENDFGINYINKFGQEKHEEYLELKQQIYFEKNETKKKKISEKLEKLGEEYNF